MMSLTVTSSSFVSRLPRDHAAKFRQRRRRSAGLGAGVASVAVGLGARYQLRAAPARDEAEAPADEHEQPVLEADQIEDVHAEPEEPRERTVDPDEWMSATARARPIVARLPLSR